MQDSSRRGEESYAVRSKCLALHNTEVPKKGHTSNTKDIEEISVPSEEISAGQVVLGHDILLRKRVLF